MSPLPYSAITSMRWLLSITAKFFRIVPGYTLTVVLATLASQLFLLLALFLPLKVIILLGSSGMPSYFPSAWKDIERDHLVIGMSLIAVAFYLLYLLAERLIGYSAEYGAKFLLQKSQKLVLFNNQDDVAIQAYQRFARSLAAVIFTLLVSCGLGLYYPTLLLALIGYGITALLLLATSQHLNTSGYFNRSTLPKLPNTLASVGFLLSFIFIVFNFLGETAPSVPIAIVSLLLVRQTMQRLAGLVVDINALHAQRLQINALFFHGHVLLADGPRQDDIFWTLLEPPRRNQWITSVLTETLKISPADITSAWHQTGAPDVAAFEVTLSTTDPDVVQCYLVKLFNSNRRDLALQEATLLADCAALSLPALDFLGASLVGQFHCHVFCWRGEQKLAARQVKSKALQVSGQLLAIEPPQALVARYGRSRPYLWQRLDNALIERLQLAARDKAAFEYISRFSQAFEHIQGLLQALPPQLINPDVNADSLLCTADGELLINQWGRWRLESIGAGWPVGEHELNLLSSHLEHARSIRSRLASVKQSDVVLSALMFAFEGALLRQQFIAAIELLPAILDQLPHHDASLATPRG